MSNFITDTYNFGSGYVFGVATNLGAQPSVVIPGQVLTLQDAHVDLSTSIKELRGIGEDPEQRATGTRKLTGKVTTGRLNLNQLNQFYFADTYTTGATATAVAEPHSIPATMPFTVTVTHSATFVQDLGVYFAGTLNQLTPVASGPITGQYSVAAGVYTFAAADEGLAVTMSYTYTTVTGHTLTVNNKAMGTNTRPTVQLYLSNQDNGNDDLIIYAAKISKLSIPWKLEDYLKLQFDFTAYANASGQLFTWYSAV